MDETITQSLDITLHQLNIGTWLNKHEELPSGKIAVKLFREGAKSKFIYFFSHSFLLGAEIGFPQNIISAFIFYLEYIKSSMTETEILENMPKITENLDESVIALIPNEIKQMLS